MPALRSLPVVALLVLLVAALSGGVFLLARSSSPPAIEILLPPPTVAPEIKVYLSGEVRRPGVYTLEPGSRLGDALEAAGGATEQADLSRLNLALRVVDEDHFDIPRLGDTQATGDGGTSLIDLNRATAAEMEAALPGIGAVKAQAIVAYRQEHGPFERVEDLLLVPGIGPATLEQLRDLATVR